MYSPDSIGLGHMRRHSAIAHALAERMPEVSSLLLAGSSATTLFDLPDGADFIKLPSVLKTSADTWQPRSLNVSTTHARNLRADLIRQAAKTFQPDIFLVDHVPAGIWGELIPTLQMFRQQKQSTKIVLGLRDILGAPEVIRESWRQDATHRLIGEFYDHILIYGYRDIYPADELYGLSECAPGKTSYCGYIFQERSIPNQTLARANLKFPAQPHVVVAAGGGHDAYPMMRRSLQALRTMCSAGAVKATVITGPLMPREQRASLEREADGLAVTLLDQTKEFNTYISAADLVITMGGYNTLMECVQLRKPTIVIPRTGPSAEQRIRANLFDRLGLARCLDLEESTASDLTGAIQQVLKGPKRCEVSLTFSGLNTASQILGGWLAEAGVRTTPDPSVNLSEYRASTHA